MSTPQDRFIAQDGRVYDTYAEMFCEPTATLMANANAWARFTSAIQSDDDRVGDVIERAGLED